MKELDIVKVPEKTLDIPEDSIGTIVYIYVPNHIYEVEFEFEEEENKVRTLTEQQLIKLN